MSKTYQKCQCGKHYSFQPCPLRGRTGRPKGKGKYNINEYRAKYKQERNNYEANN